MEKLPDYLLRLMGSQYVMSKFFSSKPECVKEHKIEGIGALNPEYVQFDGLIFHIHGTKYDAKGVKSRLLTAALEGQRVVAQDSALEQLIKDSYARAQEVKKKRSERAAGKAT